MNLTLTTIQHSNSNDNVVIGEKVFEVGDVEWSDLAKVNEGEATIHFKGAYEGYWMRVGFERGVKSGKGVLYRPNSSILLEACFVNGVCEGKVIERNESGEMVLKYELKNGVKNGYVFGYEGGRVSKVELFEEGVLKWKCVLNNSMSGYWDMYGANDVRLYTCERSDDMKEMDGICYEYEGNELKRKCVYEKNELKRVLCEWKENVMVVYREDGSRLYEGGYMYASNGYVRNGLGREYGDDGNSVIYNGDWKEGKRSGHGVWYKDGDDMETYSGEWLNNRPNGEGSLFDESGQLLYKGVWRNGILRVGGKAIDYRTGEETTASGVSVVVMESDNGIVDKEKDSSIVNMTTDYDDPDNEEKEPSSCSSCLDWFCEPDRFFFGYHDRLEFIGALVNCGYGFLLTVISCILYSGSSIGNTRSVLVYIVVSIIILSFSRLSIPQVYFTLLNVLFLIFYGSHLNSSDTSIDDMMFGSLIWNTVLSIFLICCCPSCNEVIIYIITFLSISYTASTMIDGSMATVLFNPIIFIITIVIALWYYRDTPENFKKWLYVFSFLHTSIITFFLYLSISAFTAWFHLAFQIYYWRNETPARKQFEYKRETMKLISCNSERFDFGDKFMTKQTAIVMDKQWRVKNIVVGNHSFRWVRIFEVDGLAELETFRIGTMSFQFVKDYDEKKDRDAPKEVTSMKCSFRIANCKKLTSIEIGDSSFVDYTSFELKNLPSLESIDIGDYFCTDSSFCLTSLAICVVWTYRSSPSPNGQARREGFFLLSNHCV